MIIPGINKSVYLRYLRGLEFLKDGNVAELGESWREARLSKPTFNDLLPPARLHILKLL